MTLPELNKDFKGGLSVYGTPGNKYGDTMVGGDDVSRVNSMMATAFVTGKAGVGDPVVKIGEYKGRSVFEQKAADQIRISIDNKWRAYVKLIIRQFDPGKGLLAPAGGFKDGDETDHEAAAREEAEEAPGNAGVLLSTHEIPRHPVRGDVRVWRGNDRSDGVSNGDIIAMSTTAIVPVALNAHHGHVESGDDAQAAGWVPLSELRDANLFGVKGHATMLFLASTLIGVSDQIPDSFFYTCRHRMKDVLVGSPEQQREAADIISSRHNPPANDPHPEP